ncbi:MAG: hypothetical protein RL481_354, partial [Pseudomonadota bacterium]
MSDGEYCSDSTLISEPEPLSCSVDDEPLMSVMPTSSSSATPSYLATPAPATTSAATTITPRPRTRTPATVRSRDGRSERRPGPRLRRRPVDADPNRRRRGDRARERPETLGAEMREINEMLDTGRDAHETLLRAGARRSEATRESAEGFGGVVSEMRRRSESGTIPEEDEGGLSINGDASEDQTSAEEDRIEEGIDGGEGDGTAGARGGTEEEEEGEGEEAGGRPAAGGASGIVRQRRVPNERDEQDKPLPLPKPDNEPAYLFEQPFENPSASPAFAAPLNFPDIATKEKENLPSALTNYRRRFVDAARTARFLYDDIVAQASQLAIQVRQEDNRRASRRSNDLAQALLLHDRNLAKAQLQLSNNVAHDLAQHDANLKLAIS